MLPTGFLSLALPLVFGVAGALDIDVNSADSIKSAAKTFADSIVTFYNSRLEGQAVGIFDDPYFFWEDGAAWNALIEYSSLTGDKQYNKIVAAALNAQSSDDLNFMPPNQTKTLGNDDQAVWALAALTAADTGFGEKPASGEWIDYAKNVFDNQVLRWDDTSCGGGLKWQIFSFNSGYNYKNSLTNGAFFLLSSRLALATGNKTYSDWAEKSFEWAKTIGLVSDTYSVYDGTDDQMNCSQINHIQWSWDLGVYTEGAAALYNFTNGDSKWKDAVTGFANAGTVFQDESTKVLSEVACESNGKCDTDQRAFKGLLARSLARAAVYAPFVASNLTPAVQASGKAAAAACSGKGVNLKCGMKWTEANESKDVTSVKENGLSEALSAFEAVQALLYANAPTGAIPANGTTTNAPSGSPTASKTGNAQPAQGTGAAGKVAAAGGVACMAGLFAILMI
ncbi:putative glycosyl hydrolase [Lophiotrema nucula]|uniref:Mannan endo-1,6-alpha-mannosidase n=1 Tax=Lophiotrema nucula TaxID=690887 RepID=A0A6A5YVP9_9PLEO|nr:putative glycosyl hydrolase [Lophiotrema nucula]